MLLEGMSANIKLNPLYWCACVDSSFANSIGLSFALCNIISFHIFKTDISLKLHIIKGNLYTKPLGREQGGRHGSLPRVMYEAPRH